MQVCVDQREREREREDRERCLMFAGHDAMRRRAASRLPARCGAADVRRALRASSLEPNKQGCNKRGCKSKRCGKKQNWPNLREIDRICAKLAKCVGNKRACKSIVFAKFAQIRAKFTAPFVTVPSVLVRSPESPA